MSGYTLIVDDDPTSCQMIATSLRAIGISSFSVYDGFDALARVEEDLPELIMLDLMMPGMSGIELYKRLKANPITFGIPIIVLTAVSDEATRAELPEVEHYLVKGSYHLPDLRALVADAIGRAASSH